jgi:predicted oxidoreductase
LHRPDVLFDGEELAEAFDKLSKSGKVLHFGVSNHSPIQIQLLKKYLHQDLIVNQMQFGLGHCKMISQSLEVNMNSDGGISRDGGVLEYCRLNDITLQAWSPFQSDNGSGCFIDNENYGNLNGVLWELGQKYQVSKTTIAAAWVLRHPAKIQLITGTMNINRLDEIVKATEINLSREEWYRLYLSAGHFLP